MKKGYFHNDLPFMLRRRKIEKIEKVVANLYDKNEFLIHIRNLKQTLNHRLVLKKAIILYIDAGTELRKKAKNDFERDFVKLINNSVFDKAIKKLRKHRDINLAITEKKLFGISQFFSENILEIQMKKTQILMNKSVYLSLLISEINEIAM